MANVKLCRLRDITLYHLSKHENTAKGKTTLGQLDELEADLKVWIKNFLMTCDELDLNSPSVSFIGEENAYGE